MSERVGLVRCPEVRIYDHGPQHPLRPERVLLTWELIDAYGLADAANVRGLACEIASDATLELVHTPAFIDATRRAGAGEEGPWMSYGYWPGDNPIFDRMHEAGAWVAGATLAAARSVLAGDVEHAFNAAGGLHHAMPDRASGFCVYDDPAVAIAWLLENGVERVAYVDVDVHHGDGPQFIFYDDPRVLTVSIHEYAPELGFFPGTGGLTERGVRTRRAPPSTCRCRHRGCRVARGVRRRDPRGRDTLPAAGARHAAGVRHAPLRPARASAAHHERVPRDGETPARSRPRRGRRPLGGHRRRRLPVGARRSSRVDPLLRGDGRDGGSGRDPRVVARARGVP